MFNFFEKLISPFPPQQPERPPNTLLKLCLHYTQGNSPHLFIMACLTAGNEIMEVTFFGFLGQLVADSYTLLKLPTKA